MKKILIPGFFFSIVLFSCKKLDQDVKGSLTLEEAYKIKDLGLKLTAGSVSRVFDGIYGLYGVHLSEMADQTTATNRYLQFWDFAEEPRLTINNNKSYGGYGVLNSFYSTFYQANLDANLVLDAIEVNNNTVKDLQGNDRTKDCLAAAYFAKGVAQGYLGAIYDKGIIVDKVGLETRDFPNSYKELITNGIKHLDKAIAEANANSNFKFDFKFGVTLTKEQFVKMCNSLAARILASLPRDKAEAAGLGAAHWDKVFAYANAGITTDMAWAYQDGGFYNEQLDWLFTRLYGVDPSGPGYLPVDIKVAWLADPTYPKYYPAGNAVLPPASTSDARFGQYFEYVNHFGYLNASRNKGLFSNYTRLRWDDGNNWMGNPGTVNPFFLVEELRFLKAEALLFKNDLAGAAALLNNAAAKRKAVGGLGDVPATEAAVRQALHYEYSIELDAAASVINPWAFMRRNDLLIGGTATELPIPQEQLELIGKPIYTVGGKANAGKKGQFQETATAANVGWKLSE